MPSKYPDSNHIEPDGTHNKSINNHIELSNLDELVQFGLRIVTEQKLLC